MTTTTENLWPEFDLNIEMTSSKKILLEQADFLMKVTKNILKANVATYTHTDGAIDHSFEIIAPQLNGYIYKLLTVRQSGIKMYPCTLFYEDRAINMLDENALIAGLKACFSEKSTNIVIKSLLAQSTDDISSS